MGRILQILLAQLVRCQPPPLGIRGLLRHALEHLLDGSRVADEAHRHLQALRRDVADAAPGSSTQFLLNFGSIQMLSVRLNDTRNRRNG